MDTVSGSVMIFAMELFSFAYYLFLIMSSITILYFAVITLMEVFKAKAEHRKFQPQYIIRLMIVLTIFTIINLVITPMLDSFGDSVESENKIAVEDHNIEEITDEDYQYLVQTLLLNENSIKGGIQLKATKKSMEDGYISIKEFTEIPEVFSGEISQDSLNELGISIETDTAKLILEQIVKKAE